MRGGEGQCLQSVSVIRPEKRRYDGVEAERMKQKGGDCIATERCAVPDSTVAQPLPEKGVEIECTRAWQGCAQGYYADNQGEGRRTGSG